MEEYRKLHAQRFLERQQAREAEERKVKEEIERRRNICDTVTDKLDNVANAISSALNTLDIVDQLHSISYHLEKTTDVWQVEMSDYVKTAVMNLLERINGNTNVLISYTSDVDIEASKEIQRTMKHLLHMCNILATEEEELDMDISMDCSLDEEIARRLAEEDNDHRRPIVVREPRRRKAKQQQHAGPSSTEHVDEPEELELPAPIKKKVVKKKNQSEGR